VAEEESIAKQIAKLSGVKQIWPIRIYSVPNDEIIWVGDQGTSAQSVLQKRQSNGTEDTFSTHVMTQVDQLRAEGVTGEGVRIAVIDTGIDYTHPALGGCFGEGCLVAYGTDLVGDNYNGENTPVPDPE
jgi:subtilisin family serine protease